MVSLKLGILGIMIIVRISTASSVNSRIVVVIVVLRALLSVEVAVRRSSGSRGVICIASTTLTFTYTCTTTSFLRPLALLLLVGLP